MLFYVHRLDKKNHVDLRLKTRPTHLEYLKSQSAKLFAAGPVLSPDGKVPIGSLLLVEAKDPRRRSLRQGRPVRDDDDHAVAEGFLAPGGRRASWLTCRSRR